VTGGAVTLLAGQVGGEHNAAQQPQPFLGRLEALAEELVRRGLRTKVVSSAGRVPSLRVTNPAVSRLAEHVYVGRSQDGVWWFWWPWAERVASADEVAEAADIIARVLDASR
jgi:hypothetical protein